MPLLAVMSIRNVRPLALSNGLPLSVAVPLLFAPSDRLHAAIFPRYRIVHNNWHNLLGELADVALTGIFAIQHFTKDIEKTRRVIQARLARILTRVPDHSRG